MIVVSNGGDETMRQVNTRQRKAKREGKRQNKRKRSQQ